MSEPIYAMTATELGEIFNLSARRVAQLHEEGALPRLERNKYDCGWLTHLLAGRKITQRYAKKPDAGQTVAIGWLSSLGKDPTDADLEAFGDLWIRNGLTRAAAMMAVGAAQARRVA
ncbi:hypothetical protein [Bradyrhizobium sp. AUGA SZCCT0160]|uniref:hypothetical protein n=1 Tax=Bradyrhizobium sp. AUGA SZCCT0160 TaxID=2807662 RepID=UPI001BAA2ABF|nr:hypothetical protein [Bradyrhizobium sp. AUGA SZCCT0160]MBR1193971.1 hypothetical protein [Bradyrhizobium sp. AUGA SZCCT0160]